MSWPLVAGLIVVCVVAVVILAFVFLDRAIRFDFGDLNLSGLFEAEATDFEQTGSM